MYFYLTLLNGPKVSSIKGSLNDPLNESKRSKRLFADAVVAISLWLFAFMNDFDVAIILKQNCKSIRPQIEALQAPLCGIGI